MRACVHACVCVCVCMYLCVCVCACMLCVCLCVCDVRNSTFSGCFTHALNAADGLEDIRSLLCVASFDACIYLTVINPL